MKDPELVATVREVRGDSVTASLTAEAAPGLTFSKGHAYQVGQVGAFVRIPLGLVDIFAVVVQVGAAPPRRPETDADHEDVPWAAAGEAWMRLELFAEGARGGSVRRGVARYPAIGDPVHLVAADDLNRLYGAAGGASLSAVRLGHVANAPQLTAHLNINTLVTRHSAVVGSTGTGKSSTVCGLLGQLGNRDRFPGARVIVVDVHGEYGAALGNSAKVRRVKFGRPPDEGLDDGLYLPYWALTVDELVLLAFGSLDDTSAASVRDWILARKRETAAGQPQLGLKPEDVTADTPLPFSIHRLWFEFHELVHSTHTAHQDGQTPQTRAYQTDSNGDELRGSASDVTPPTYKPIGGSGADRVLLSQSNLSMRKQLETLASLLRDPRYAFMFTPGPWAPDLDGNVTEGLDTFLRAWLDAGPAIAVADLSNVPTAVLRDVVAVLLRVLYDALVWGRHLPEGGRARPLLVVLEEAHRYLGDDAGSAATMVERIVKEGRKYGVGLLLVSQRPSDIRPTVLSQIGTFVVLRLTNRSDLALVRATLPDHLGGLFDAVPVLRTGEAIVVGEATHLPTRVVTDLATGRPNSADPFVVTDDASAGWNAPVLGVDYDELAVAWRCSGAIPTIEAGPKQEAEPDDG